jgi:hypothetical protein
MQINNLNLTVDTHDIRLNSWVWKQTKCAFSKYNQQTSELQEPRFILRPLLHKKVFTRQIFLTRASRLPIKIISQVKNYVTFKNKIERRKVVETREKFWIKIIVIVTKLKEEYNSSQTQKYFSNFRRGAIFIDWSS